MYQKITRKCPIEQLFTLNCQITKPEVHFMFPNCIFFIVHCWFCYRNTNQQHLIRRSIPARRETSEDVHCVNHFLQRSVPFQDHPGSSVPWAHRHNMHAGFHFSLDMWLIYEKYRLQKCAFWLTVYESTNDLLTSVSIYFQQTVSCNSETSLH